MAARMTVDEIRRNFSDEDSNEDQYGSYGNDGHYDAG